MAQLGHLLEQLDPRHRLLQGLKETSPESLKDFALLRLYGRIQRVAVRKIRKQLVRAAPMYNGKTITLISRTTESTLQGRTVLQSDLKVRLCHHWRGSTADRHYAED
jgi:hypothetical protein